MFITAVFEKVHFGASVFTLSQVTPQWNDNYAIRGLVQAAEAAVWLGPPKASVYAFLRISKY